VSMPGGLLGMITAIGSQILCDTMREFAFDCFRFLQGSASMPCRVLSFRNVFISVLHHTGTSHSHLQT
jgi:hypothetical protein